MADPIRARVPIILDLDTTVEAAALEDGDEDLAERVLRRGVELERERLPVGTHAVYISLVFTDDEGIAALNRRFRGIDAPTDVLSFPAHEANAFSGPELRDAGDAAVENATQAALPLGDIVVSLPRAGAQAQEYGHTRQRELGFLLVHGLLHLLGYDHASQDEAARMEARQEAVLQSLGLRRDQL